MMNTTALAALHVARLLAGSPELDVVVAQGVNSERHGLPAAGNVVLLSSAKTGHGAAGPHADTVLGATTLSTENLNPSRIGQCNPVEGPGLAWTAAERAETRARVQAVCEHVGASRAVCTYLDVIVVRESSGRPGVRHDDGRGLGAMGLMISAHRDKWPGDDEDPALCQPEASALVALAILHRAARRWNAGNLVELQAVYSGRMRTIELEDGTTLRTPGRTVDANLCSRLAKRGVRCLAPITRRDLGRAVPIGERRALAARLAEEFSRRE